MIKGFEIILSVDSTAIAAATNASITLTQAAEEYTPLPGTTEDDGWVHYRTGMLSWDLSHDGILTEDSKELIAKIDDGDCLSASLLVGSKILSGTVHLSEVGIVAQIDDLARISAKFKCNNFPTIQ